MNVKKIYLVLLLTFLLVGSLNISSAKDQSFNVHYNLDSPATFEKEISFDSTIMKLTTWNNTVCKYDINSGKTYSDMNNVFFDTGGSHHSEKFLDLSDGTHFYFVKCKSATTFNEPEELKVILRVNSLVTGSIILDKSSPISEGELEVKLYTSKYVSGIPMLSYSFDGVGYNSFVLVGDGNAFKGSIVLEDSLGEGVLYFKMSAVDLEGRQGTEITSGAYFSYDLVRPSVISNINAVSSAQKIRLDWHTDEESIREFKIYRSEFANVDYTDYYDKADDDEDYYLDDELSSRKTYYYRVSVVDEAGNEGPLSREISSTSLSEDGEITSGLNPSLYGIVESFLVEIGSLNNNIELAKDSILELGEKEKYLAENLGLVSKIDSSKKEITSIKASTEKLKEQDLEKEALDAKINSLRVRMGILEKGVPSELLIINEKERVESMTDSKKENAIFAIKNSIEIDAKDKSIKETNKYLNENELSVKSYFYDIKVSYLDDSKKEYSAVKRILSSDFTQMESSYFIENIPDSVEENQDRIIVKNNNYDFIGESSVIAFDTDTKEIFYYVPKVTNFRNLEEIEFSFVKIINDESSSSSITGFSIFGEGASGYAGIIVLVIVILGILYYFIHSRNSNFSDDYFRMSNKINEAKDCLREEDIEKAKKIYSKVKVMYNDSPQKEKDRLYSDLETLYNNILIFELTTGLTTLSKTKDIKLFTKLSKIFDSLPSEKKDKISPLFNKIKEDLDNEK